MNRCPAPPRSPPLPSPSSPARLPLTARAEPPQG